MAHSKERIQDPNCSECATAACHTPCAHPAAHGAITLTSTCSAKVSCAHTATAAQFLSYVDKLTLHPRRLSTTMLAAQNLRALARTHRS